MTIQAPDSLVQHSTAWLKNVALKAGKNALVVNISGGLTSAVTLALAEKTGLETYAVVTGALTKEQKAQALQVVKKSNSHLVEVPLSVSSIMNSLEHLKSEDSDSHPHLLTTMSGAVLDQVAKLVNGIVLGSDTKETSILREQNKRGGAATDAAPLGDLYVSEVVELAAHLGLDSTLLTGTSSLGISYDRVEELMRKAEKLFASSNADGMDKVAEVLEVMGLKEQEVHADLILLRDTEFKTRHKYNPLRPINRVRGEFDMGMVK